MEKIIEIKQIVPLSSKVELPTNWESETKEEFIQDILKFSPEQLCEVDPELVVGNYPFDYNMRRLENMDLVQVIFLKNILQNKWKK